MVIVAITAVWLALGAVAVVVMRSRGHDAFSWTVLFLFLGPLALPLAITADRHRPLPPAALNHAGVLDVLVADNGSADTEAALQLALGLFEGRMTSLTVAAVLDLEAPTTVRGHAAEREAQERLDVLAQRATEATTAPVDTVILYGEPGHAFQEFAADHGYELIVTGHAARRSSQNVATRVTRGGSVPVLVGPSGQRGASARDSRTVGRWPDGNVPDTA